MFQAKPKPGLCDASEKPPGRARRAEEVVQEQARKEKQ
jgi:hypothetical protein